MKKLFRRVYIINDALSKEFAAQAVQAGEADAASFVFIANPDLPARLHKDAELNSQHAETFYGGGDEGYADYPALARCL